MKTYITNAKIYTMNKNDEIIENGFILIENHKIILVGEMRELPAIKPDTEIIDAMGKIVTPGLVDAHSHLGMWEDGLNEEGDDGNEETTPITPHLRAIDAINPLDNAFKEAFSSGITTVLSGPGSANPISGQFAAIKTYGKCIDNMIIKAE